jgi:hypothetical protein
MLTVQEIRQVISEKIPEGLIVPAHTDQGHFYLHVPSGQSFASVTTKMQGEVDNPHLKIWASRLAAENMADRILQDKTYLDDTVRLTGLKDESIMIHRDQFESAGIIGTLSHSAVEKYNDEWIEIGLRPINYEKFLDGKDPRETAVLRSAMEFYNDFYYIPVASELLVCNLKDKYAGTLDCLGFVILDAGVCPKADNQKHDFSWQLSSKDWTKRECIHCGKKAKYRLALIDYKTSNSIKKKPTYCAQVSAYAKAFNIMTGIKVHDHIIVRLDKKQAKYEAIRIKDPVECYRNFKLMQALSPWLDPSLDHAEPIIKKEIIKI